MDFPSPTGGLGSMEVGFVRSFLIRQRVAWVTLLALATIVVGVPHAWAKTAAAILPTTHARKILAIPPNDPNDHHLLEDLARAGLLRHSPQLPHACLTKTPRGRKYILSPAGPDVCSGNTVRLWIGEEVFHFLRCQGSHCETLETFRPNAAAAVGEQALSYWSTRILKEPRIVLWRPTGG